MRCSPSPDAHDKAKWKEHITSHRTNAEETEETQLERNPPSEVKRIAKHTKKIPKQRKRGTHLNPMHRLGLVLALGLQHERLEDRVGAGDDAGKEKGR
jgi:hypothetical protein